MSVEVPGKDEASDLGSVIVAQEKSRAELRNGQYNPSNATWWKSLPPWLGTRMWF